MGYEYKIVRQVEFFETDMAGIMHFSNFFRFMEAAEHAFFRSLGLSIHDSGPMAVRWPRVHAECDYRRPLRFEDSVEVHLLVQEKRSRSIIYSFRFAKLNESSQPEVARGALVVACAHSDDTGQLTGIAIPASIAGRISAAPAELLAV